MARSRRTPPVPAAGPAAPAAAPLRLSSPGEVAAAVPLLLGFVPQDSLVALGLTGTGAAAGRLVLTARTDLADLADLADTATAGGGAAGPARLAGALLRAGARRVLLVVHSDAPAPAGGEPVAAALVARLSAGLSRRGLAVVEALLVSGGRWRSYTCTLACCPPEGTPVDGSARAVQALAAERVGAAGAVLGGREELVASLSPAPTLAPALVRRLQEQALAALAERRAGAGSGPTVAAELARWRRAVEHERRSPAATGTGPDPGEVAALVVGLSDVAVRDAVVAGVARAPEPGTGLLRHLARQAVPPHDAPLCAVLGAALLLAGDGASARVALDRSLAAAPGGGLAALLLQCLDAAVPPREVRRVLRAGAGPSWEAPVL